MKALKLPEFFLVLCSSNLLLDLVLAGGFD